jgi:hypothetical protein
MIYRINFAVLRAHLEIQENALEKIKNMFDTLNCLKILGESEGDFVAAMEGLEVELKELLGKQADIFHISTASLSRYIEAVVPLLRPVNEKDDVVYDAPGMANFVSDVEYEVCDMAERTKKPFWYTTRLSADRAEKNRGLIEHNQKVANGVQEKYWETYWNAVNKLEEIKETIKPWKEFEQVDLDLGDAMRQQLIDSGGIGVWISETLSDIKDDFDPAIGFVLSVKDALVGCVELGVYAIDYLATFLVWCLNIGMDDDNPETARIRQKFDDYNKTICDSGEVILTTILKGTGDLVTDPVRAGRNIDSFMVDATNDQAMEYGLTPSGDVGAAIVLGSLVDPVKGAGKVSKVNKISKFSKYEKFVDNGMPVGRTGYGKLKVVDRTGMIKEMQEVAAGPPKGMGGVDDIATGPKLVKDPHTGANLVKVEAPGDPKRVDALAFDPDKGKIALHEGEAAAKLETALGGKMERVEVPPSANQPKTPDYKFVDGPYADKTVDFMWTVDANNPKAVSGLNDNFAKYADGNRQNILDHLNKADLVPLDYRNLTPANQSLADSWIKSFTPEQQSRIIILR